MEKNFLPLGRSENIVVQTLADETLIYDLSNDQAFCLNETCGLVWQECDGTKSIADISRILSTKMNTQIPEELVQLALDNLHKNNLLIEDTQLTTMFAGISRREVIKKVGLATAVAIPVVASMLAPASADAASTTICSVQPGFPCVVGSTNPAQCCPPPTFCFQFNATFSFCASPPVP